MSAECASELVTLSAAFKSFQGYMLEADNPVMNSQYRYVATQYGEEKRQHTEDVAKVALMKLVKDNIEGSSELISITTQALLGNKQSQAQLKELSEAIKTLIDSPINTLSESIKSELAEADRLEKNGQIREAEILRMKTYLSTELGVLGGLTGGNQLIQQGTKGAIRLGKLGLSTKAIANKNVGIQWGEGIINQGKPWESYLMSFLPEGTINLNDIKLNFKTFDHLLPDGTAISAKTMDTVGSKTYQNPSRITSQLNKYVDDMVKFDSDGQKNIGFELKNSDIHTKEIYLAIPKGSSKEQIEAINKSIKYAESNGVKIIIKEVK
ncbi:hypothetical protein IO47_11055 [Gallibacterium anatis]|nr:hypothetical protein IO47_11055 [Gallibacterium anatis]